MKKLKQLAIGVAVGIALFVLFESLLGFIGMALVLGIAYWTIIQEEQRM